MKKYILLIVFSSVLGFQNLTHAQDICTANARIVDAEDGKGLPSASIKGLGAGNYGTVSDEGGVFSMDIPEDGLDVEISFVGYQRLRLRLKCGENQTILLETGQALEDQIVISAGRISKQDKVPLAVQQIGRAQWVQGSEVSLMQEIGTLPGVELISMGNGIGKPVIRGLSFSRVLTSFQGARFENQQWGADHGLGVNDLGIASVEVIKGPASILYGSGAVGGVMYMVDEAPARPGTWRGEVGSQFHSNSLGIRNHFGLSTTGQSGFFIQAYGAYENHADYLDGNGNAVNNTRFNTQTFRLLGGKNYDRGQLKLGYTYHKQLLGFIDDEEMAAESSIRNDRSMLDLYQDIDDHVFSIEWKHRWAGGEWEARLNHHQHIRQEIEDFDDIELGLNQGNTYLDLKYFLPMGEYHTHTFGVQSFVKSNQNSVGVEGVLFPDAQVWDKSLFYLLEKESPRLNSQLGLRYDHRITHADASSEVIQNAENDYVLPLPDGQVGDEISLSHSGFSGSAGLNFNLHPNLILKANLSSGFRAPDLAELFSNGRHPGTARFERGNTSFEREQSYQSDLVLIFQPKANFRFEFSPFLNYVNNYIFFRNTGQNLTDQGLEIWQFEQEDARLHGAEIRYTWQIPWGAGLEIEQSLSSVRGIARQTGETLPFIPADRSRVQLRWTKGTGSVAFPAVRANLSWLAVNFQDRMGQGERSTPGYQLVHTGLGTDMLLGNQRVHLDLAIHNLFNTAYFDHLSFYWQQFGLMNMGRNVRLNLRIPFGQQNAKF